MMQNIRIAVDAVVFGFKNNQLYVLLIQQKFGSAVLQWALPGGLVQNDETLHEAILRELKEETNVEVNYLEQLYTFGDDVQRDHRNRVISVAYFGLVDPSKFQLVAATDAVNAQWIAINEIPKLAFDHASIVAMAHLRLKNKLTYQPIGFDLLPKKFLFSELENLYCIILEKEIDRRNFRKKILSFGIVVETNEIAPQLKSGRPAKLFRFNNMIYQALEVKGFHFEINFT
ncbi:NUDIX hydrolase [Flavobacterium branchiophilum]|uniref:NUDIX hydrolase n=1 Tax=Flavobacterium branchiophilum TaxID=55197 RepID=A0A2H3KGF9_9FLAO|nr:NUDIX domain-containing protein [Flavobacterium branchiophilum]PDS22732.1 NUDIX hydrolase [Flavobacterium branchiophilum]